MKFKFLFEKLSYDEALTLFDLPSGYTADDVNRKFKRLAMKYHPDRGGSVEQMQDINDARDMLLRTAGSGTSNRSNTWDEEIRKSKEQAARKEHEIEEIILDVTKNYFDNLNTENFKRYFKSVFNSDFDVTIEYSKFFENCHKYSWDYNPAISAVFESPDRNKIIKMRIFVDYASLFSMINIGSSLSTNDMQVYYKTELYIDGKKQKVAQTLYSSSNKKAILIDPEIMFPPKKMQKIASGEKRKGVILKKRDFESMIKLKHKGDTIGVKGLYAVPICGTSSLFNKIYAYIGRDTYLKVGVYYITDNLEFWFPNGGALPDFAKIKEDYAKLIQNTKASRYRLYETESSLRFLDEMFTALNGANFDDIIRVIKPFLDRLPEIHDISKAEFEGQK